MVSSIDMRILDAFCGEGGATAGYQRAGFEVTGAAFAAVARVAIPGRSFMAMLSTFCATRSSWPSST